MHALQTPLSQPTQLMTQALRKSAGFIAAALLASGSLIAMEQAQAAPGGKADANKDGNISREEAAKHPHMAQNFDKIDANKDGMLSKAELQAYAKAHEGEGFKMLDADGNGSISRAEAAKHPRLTKHFDQIDTNKDGSLSKEELQAFRAAHGKK